MSLEVSKNLSERRDPLTEIGDETDIRVDLLIHPIGELATPDVSEGPAKGERMRSAVKRYKKAAIAVSGNRILAAGEAESVLSKYRPSESTQVIDASNKLVTPGLVDPHTHLIFSGNRANEFAMRCQGKTYKEIADAGGGIVASMRATRGASVEQLVSLGLERLGRMLAAGTTTCEVKTGYGLDKQSELAMLEAIYILRRQQPIDLVPTFMPAHAFPPEVDRSEYITSIVDDMLPSAVRVSEKYRAEANAVEQINTEDVLYVDVFCDEGYFTLADTRKIFEAGAKLGLKPRVHADEFKNLGASRLACEFGAVSADHLLNVSDEEIKLFATGDTIAVVLPGTSFFLNLPSHAPARKMIDSGVALALGSDFNPGSCHIFSLPMIWGLACLHLKLTAEEALSALTVNAAYAVGRGGTVGQLTCGRQADITIYDVQTLEEIPYNLGWNPVCQTVKAGKLVHSC